MRPKYTSFLDACLLPKKGWLYFKAQSDMLGFIELILDVFDQLQGKYTHDNFVKRYYMRTKSSNDSTKSPYPWRQPHISKGQLYWNGDVWVPNLPQVKKKISSSTLEYIKHLL